MCAVVAQLELTHMLPPPALPPLLMCSRVLGGTSCGRARAAAACLPRHLSCHAPTQPPPLPSPHLPARQVILNWRLRSTAGWNMHNVALDFGGGMLSLVQLLMDGAYTQDWTAVTGVCWLLVLLACSRLVCSGWCSFGAGGAAAHAAWGLHTSGMRGSCRCVPMLAWQPVAARVCSCAPRCSCLRGPSSWLPQEQPSHAVQPIHPSFFNCRQPSQVCTGLCLHLL